MKNKLIRRIATDGILVAMFCVIGMFSIPFGDSVKVSLQLLFVFVIGLANFTDYLDCLEITIAYLVIGLVLPVYAGFNTGISPTFGYVISFVFASCLIKLLNDVFEKKIKMNKYASATIVCLIVLLFVYIVGSVFFCIYLSWSKGLWNMLMLTVIPYLPFDILKIAMAILLTSRLNKVNLKGE